MKRNYNGKLLSQSLLDDTIAIENEDDDEGSMECKICYPSTFFVRI